VILVDAANVVGSRPTGWWRDRAGAAGTLVEQLRAAVGNGRIDAPVVVVLEGRARGGAAEGTAAGVEVVHAPGEGDDTLVELAARHVPTSEVDDEEQPGTRDERSSPAGAPPDGAALERVLLVTADRGLRRRAEAVGASVVGPSWLHHRLGHR
jgi:hypothetical protein